jgi:WD40 repeat protein
MDGHNNWVTAVAFSPNGSLVVTASGDGTARLWEPASGRPVAVLKGHGKEITSAAFSPDGSRVVTASTDNTARVWTLDALAGESGVFPDWVEVYTGTEMTEEGVVRPLSASEWKDRCQKLLRKHPSEVPPTPWLQSHDTAAKTERGKSPQ